jgi:hypothetical protein
LTDNWLVRLEDGQMPGDIIPFFKAIFEAMPQEYGFLFSII